MQNDFEYYTILDEHPFTGIRKVDFYAKISQSDHIMKFFNGTENYEQVNNVTPGKTYHITEVEGYGDVSDFKFVDDNGEYTELGNYFFEDVKDE